MPKPQPGRSPRRKLWGAIIVIAFLVLVALVVSVFLRFRGAGPVPEDPLAGFTIMNLPRRDLDIGAVWTQGVGPVRGSGGIPRLQTRSLDSAEISRAAKLHGSVNANMARSLNLSASGSDQDKETLKLKGLTIVTVGDAARIASV